MDKKRKAVIAGFFIFLLAMGMCSLVTKGIYTAGLPQVTAILPREMSLYHPVTVSGIVETGQEYGVYAPAGLRVASIAVQKGDSFQEGDALIQLDVEDLERIAGEKELERQRLAYQQRESESRSLRDRQEQDKTLTRAREDYETARINGELLVGRAGENRLQAQKLLEELKKQLDQAGRDLEQCRKQLEQAEKQESQDGDAKGNESGSVSGGDSGDILLPGNSGNASKPDSSAIRQQIAELEAVVTQLQGQVDQQEEAVKAASRALEDAQVSQAGELWAAQRGIQDALEAGSGGYQAATDLAALEQSALEEEIRKLEELIEMEGWLRAREGGRITQLCVGVGQRTPDTAQLLYTPDDGTRLLQARLDKGQAQYVSEGTRMQMNYETVSEGKQSGEGIISYLEPQEDGSVLIQLDVTEHGMGLGQQVTLKSTWQSEKYSMVVPLSVLHEDSSGADFVYILRQQNGILGVEWHASILYVDVLDQNSSHAAIESGALSEETRIIQTASGELKENAVVRIVE